MNAPAISITNLTVAFNNKPVLWNLTTDIPYGIMLGIIGPNGAGKTTFIKALLGLIKPLAGSITLLGMKNIKDAYTKIAYVPQRMSVDWDFPVTIFDVVMMGRFGSLGWFKRPQKADRDVVMQALAQVGLDTLADQHISELSCGQQQRVFLARALVQNPEMYILDEPFVGVDAVTEKIIITQLHALRSQGKTILAVHHDLQTLHHYFDWLLLLNKEKIACGPLATLEVSTMLDLTYRTTAPVSFSMKDSR